MALNPLNSSNLEQLALKGLNLAEFRDISWIGRFHCGWYQGNWVVDTDASHHRLSRQRITSRLSVRECSEHSFHAEAGALGSQWDCTSALRNTWNARWLDTFIVGILHRLAVLPFVLLIAFSRRNLGPLLLSGIKRDRIESLTRCPEWPQFVVNLCVWCFGNLS